MICEKGASLTNKVLITGAGGFIGKNFQKHTVECNVRNVVRRPPIHANEIEIKRIDGTTNWHGYLNEVNAVVHFASLAHESAWEATQNELYSVNVEGSVNLAKSSISAGVKRFIFLSSIGVNGNNTHRTPFSFLSDPQPHDDYSVSKFEAEKQLKELFEGSATELVIIRPPLVYGPGVKANFLSMLKWVSRGVPLPLGGIRNNKRSLVYVENLVDLIKVCIDHPAAANQTFLVSDGEDVSTCALLKRVAHALEVKSLLLPIPPSWLGFAGWLLGKHGIEQRLCSSLQVDISHTKNTLNWKPPYSMEEGLKKTAEWYKSSKS